MNPNSIKHSKNHVDDSAGETDTQPCLVAFVFIGAFLSPVIFLMSLALGYGFLKSVLISFALAAPVTVFLACTLRFFVRSRARSSVREISATTPNERR